MTFLHQGDRPDSAVQRDGAQASWRVVPCGDRCLVIDLEQGDVVRSNNLACEIAERLTQANLPGVTDVMPSMAAVGVHYDPAAVVGRDTSSSPWRVLVSQVNQLLDDVTLQDASPVREIVLPVCYGGEYGADLEDVAHTCGLTPEEVIRLHSESQVRVFMLGFAPGHPYIGMFDERLAIGRRATPRTAVPQGSIGLANRQSVIYPTTLPGGWSLIGRTPLALFDPYQDPPCLLSPGDRIRFKPITPDEFVALERQQEGAS